MPCVRNSLHACVRLLVLLREEHLLFEFVLSVVACTCACRVAVLHICLHIFPCVPPCNYASLRQLAPIPHVQPSSIPDPGSIPGHWIGMDTHDVANVSHEKPLQPGVVLTVEPGLYFPEEEQYGHFAGIGVRIEDDVAVTASTPCVLSDAVPTARDQIEHLVGSEV